jgi:alpha-D-ribose 1-methylphosphonate 5-triphosphate synthase subunit PhnI
MVQRQQSSKTARDARPVYELCAQGIGGGQFSLEIWQLPSPATPRLVTKERTAALKGRALEIVEAKVLRQMKNSGIRIPALKKGETKAFPLDEDIALNMALLFRTLAPMTSIERIRQVAQGIDQMSREEAGYWLGMAVHRKYPRRVLAALRMLLTM